MRKAILLWWSRGRSRAWVYAGVETVDTDLTGDSPMTNSGWLGHAEEDVEAVCSTGQR